jgi:hypothetical protein
MRRSPVSGAHLFAKRGDPWISPREGRDLFGRNLRTEDPDMDMFTRASRAPERFERGPDKPLSPKTIVASPRRRIANILRGMNRRLHADHGLIIIAEPPAKILPPVLNKAKSIQGYLVYSLTLDGEEHETNHRLLERADKAFNKLVKDRKTVLIELWDNNAELIKIRRRSIRGKKGDKN